MKKIAFIFSVLSVFILSSCGSSELFGGGIKEPSSESLDLPDDIIYANKKYDEFHDLRNNEYNVDNNLHAKINISTTEYEHILDNEANTGANMEEILGRKEKYEFNDKYLDSYYNSENKSTISYYEDENGNMSKDYFEYTFKKDNKYYHYDNEKITEVDEDYAKYIARPSTNTLFYDIFGTSLPNPSDNIAFNSFINEMIHSINKKAFSSYIPQFGASENEGVTYLHSGKANNYDENDKNNEVFYTFATEFTKDKINMVSFSENHSEYTIVKKDNKEYTLQQAISKSYEIRFLYDDKEAIAIPNELTNKVNTLLQGNNISKPESNIKVLKDGNIYSELLSSKGTSGSKPSSMPNFEHVTFEYKDLLTGKKVNFNDIKHCSFDRYYEAIPTVESGYIAIFEDGVVNEYHKPKEIILDTNAIFNNKIYIFNNDDYYRLDVDVRGLYVLKHI